MAAKIHKVATNLFFSDISVCTPDYAGHFAMVHACKSPCYIDQVGVVSKGHPSYLVFEKDFHLYLNMIDPPVPLFMLPTFTRSLDFIDKYIRDLPVLIHCNRGESRSPSLALVYLAKRLNALPVTSYEEAAKEFCQYFPYNPGYGIQTWLSINWANII